MPAPKVALLHGDSLTLLNPPDNGWFRAESADGTVLCGATRRIHACITDPPYGFDFGAGNMNAADWATDEDRNKERVAWDSFEDKRKFATAADDAAQFAKFTRDWSYRLRQDYLYPGAHLMAFSADRTIDLVGRGLREAGYDLCRLCFWLYASGQVKNPNDLRPGCEPIFIARSPTTENLTDLYKKKGLGQMNAQVWKVEDGKHPTNILVDDTLVQAYAEVAEMVEKHPGTFFVPKPAPRDRDWGCADLPVQQKDNRLSHMTSEAKGKVTKPVMAQNVHPTVKSIELMRRLVRLVTKPGHTIIDPFLGSGTTGVAAVLEGRNFIGIERDKDYLPINHTRIAYALREMGDEVGADALLAQLAQRMAA